VLLHTGDVLIAGGITASGQTSATSLIYSANDGSLRPTLNPLAEGRAYYSLVIVPIAGGSSRLFAIGGYNGASTGYRSVASVEVADYDVAADNWRWRTIGNMTISRGDLAATWDGGSYIIVGGGRTQTTGQLHTGTQTVATDRININTLQIEKIGDMNTARSEHALVRVTDALGKNLAITASGESTRPTTATELLVGTNWDPRANPPLVYRSSAVGVGDPAGIGRMFGGFDGNQIPLNTCEWYDVKSGWRFAPRMETERARAHATVVAGTRDTAAAYLIVAGQGIAGPVRKTEVFALPNGQEPNGVWTPFSDLNFAAAERTVNITGQNLALTIGGETSSGLLDGTEIFQPLRADDLTFGFEETGRLSDSLPLVIKNEWLLPVRVRNIRIAGSAEFVYYGDTTNFVLPPSGQRTLFVRFRPTVVGARTGQLLLDIGSITTPVILRGTGVKSNIDVVTASFSFDSVLVKTSKQLCFPAITNRGNEPATIDSVVLTPPGVYRLISPIGRVTIPPGDTLKVCVEFLPTARGAAISSMDVHLADRNYPIVLDGVGVRRFATATTASGCDTITHVPGTSHSAFVTLRNPSDRPVTITQADFNASTAGLFALADPTILPLTLLPGESKLVEVLFTPQREATERATVSFVNDGDTATAASLCFIVRSRYLSPSVPSVDFGSICVGDTAVRTVLLENPGGFDSVNVDAVTINDPTASVVLSNVPATRLGPHQYVSVTARFAPQTAGPFSGVIVVTGSFGSVTLPVTGTVLPGLRFTPSQLSAAPATIVVIPVELQGSAGAQVAGTRLTFDYNRTLLYPLRLVSLQGAGMPVLDATASRLAITRPGQAVLDVAWSTPISADGPAFGIEAEVLRGDNNVAALALSGSGTGDYCIARASAVVLVSGPCGGESGLIRSEGASMLRIIAPPAQGKLKFDVISPKEGALHIQLFNILGTMLLDREVGQHANGRTESELSLENVPSGTYFVRVLIDREAVDHQPVVITGR
jgi:hypothetical protein